MARKSRVIGFSVPAEVEKEYAQLATRLRTTKSELFRRMVESFKARLEEEEFYALQRRISRKVRKKMGPLTEEQIERLVFEDR